MSGRKDDSQKPRLELIPPIVLFALAKVLTPGARKYHQYNWAGADEDGTPHHERGLAWSREYGALLRHLCAWWGGEDKDPESGMSHLWHALCELAFLVTSEEYGIGKDDRFAWEQRAVSNPPPGSGRDRCPTFNAGMTRRCTKREDHEGLCVFEECGKHLYGEATCARPPHEGSCVPESTYVLSLFSSCCGAEIVRDVANALPWCRTCGRTLELGAK